MSRRTKVWCLMVPAFVVAAICSATANRAQSEPPSTGEARPAPCGGGETVRRVIDEFVAAYNSGKAETMLAFHEEMTTPEFRGRRSEEEHRALYLKLYGHTGRLHVRGIRIAGHQEVTLEAAGEEADESVRVRFELEAEPPHRISAYAVQIGGPEGSQGSVPPPAISRPVSDEEGASQLDAYFADLERRDLFSGVVLVVRDDRTLFEGAYGLADRERGVPNRIDTRFNVGSITKMLTKVAVGQLARDGKLGLDDTILRHLPDYPNEDVARKVTIRRLLDHTAGLGDIFNEKFRSTEKESLIRPRDFIGLFGEEELLFEPGESERYSNAGYVVLGAIVEAASGMPYERYVRRNVFEPAGMEESGFLVRDGSIENVAIGYTCASLGPEEGRLRSNVGIVTHRGCPAGGSSSSAGDLLHFDRALRGGRLLGDAWTEWYFAGVEPGVRATEPEGGKPPAGRPIAIAGGALGVNAIVESDSDTVVIVMANMDPPVAMEIARNLHSVPGIWND